MLTSFPGISERAKALNFRERHLILAQCWEQARGDNLVTERQSFMDRMLEFPDMMLDLAIVELRPDGIQTYLYVGNSRVRRRRNDRTRMDVESAFSPDAYKQIGDWFLRIQSQPFAAFWIGETELVTGEVGRNENLAIPLAEPDGTICHVASVVWSNEAFARVEFGGELILSSLGLSYDAIDLGAGIPDL